ncbi:HNH endonuclease family protein [Arthrobacter sp. SX1312]|uniref:HNH endonuclease family protein n=1 Tax=Arthrobacter sp. SX1312 TaxID=2058896 RepID=UPI001C6679DC|nr:HNH endonuclease family protein [Arthrobacter sp. SX1312]
MSRTTGPAHMTSKTTSRSSRLTLAAAGALLALGLSGCDARAALDGPTGPNSAASQSPASAGTALAALEQIPLKGRAPKTGYSREEFGSAWADVDRDGCDTRNQVLNRDLSDVLHATSVPCKVEFGVLDDPYTGARIEFQRGQDTSSDVQIDHIIALSNAWQTGAQQLTAEERLQLANDPLNLRSADGPTNGAKGDGDAATWLPPNKAFRCEYVATQTAVKAKYELWMTAAEHDAIVRVLDTCPDQPLPTRGGAKGQPVAVDETPAPAATEEPGTEASAAPAGEIAYADCAEVKATGTVPIMAGDPGFSPAFDGNGNGDGIGCES